MKMFLLSEVGISLVSLFFSSFCCFSEFFLRLKKRKKKKIEREREKEKEGGGRA